MEQEECVCVFWGKLVVGGVVEERGWAWLGCIWVGGECENMIAYVHEKEHGVFIVSDNRILDSKGEAESLE